MCSNKTNLLFALLRAIKIPAGYGIFRVRTKEFYGDLMCPVFEKLVSPETTHIFAGIYLGGKWIKSDVSLDNDLALKGKTPFSSLNKINIGPNKMKKIKGILKRSEFQ